MNQETTYNIKEVKEVKEVCLKLMAIDERCRNDDLWLMLQGYRELGFNIYIDYHQLEKMPRPETFKRMRAIIQNKDKMFPPTSLDVIRRRKKRQKVMEQLK